MPPRYATVVFDCDSTLVSMEGIEELARDSLEEVAALTEAAMRGDVALEEVYGRRLELVRPSLAAVEALGRRYIEALVPGAAEAVAELRQAGARVCIVSGGLLPAVLPLALRLGLGVEDVAAVDVYFDEAGVYAGFDTASPLSRSGGKREVLEAWRLPRPIVLVGDGATDLEAAPAVDAFIAFTGVVERPQVAAAASATARSMADVLRAAGC